MFDEDNRDRGKPAPDPLDAWPAFAESVRQRLEAGRAAYGDKSFQRPPAELIGELQQEALDLAGWGFVLWCRLEAAVRQLDVAPCCHTQPAPVPYFDRAPLTDLEPCGSIERREGSRP